LGWVSELKPRRAFFTHICHDLPHEQTNAALPEHVRLAYDGLEIDLDNHAENDADARGEIAGETAANDGENVDARTEPAN
jgi:hypothetical protein